MSGYRSIHREQVLETAIWEVACTDLLTKKPSDRWRIWTAAADGLVRSYVVQESSIDSKKDALDASALKLLCTHELGEPFTLGCTRVSAVRNYVGDDDQAGDLVVASLELAGKVRIWNFAEDFDAKLEITDGEPRKNMKSWAEFEVKNATGTTLKVCPPRVYGSVDVALAVGLLDGTVAIVAAGLVTPKAAKKEPSSAGTVLDSWGSQGSAVPLSLAWHPKTSQCLAVGRQDGLVDILTGTRKNQHRLTQHKAPVRALAFTDDGQLLIAGGDDGFLCVWDMSRKVPSMVHHVLQAHRSWIMDLAVLQDSRRFVTVGAERQIHVWSLDQMYQPVHTFHSDQSVWSVNRGPRDVPRLVTASDSGGLQVYSIES